MLILCDEIQRNRSKMFQMCSEKVSDIVNWYETTYNNFASKLKTEQYGESSKKYEAEYEILAKEKLLNITEPLIKLSLTKFSYGPTRTFFDTYGFVPPTDECLTKMATKSWLDTTLDFATLTEILAHVLEVSQIEYDFDLKVLASDRDQRNNNDHQGTRIDCMTLIRKFKSIRGVLVFLDPENDRLPYFQEEGCFDYDQFIAAPSSFSFKEALTVLLVDSIHDIPNGYRNVVANLPWNVVVDFDGYSNFGGLLSSISHNCIRKELLLPNTVLHLPALDRLQTMWYRCGEYLLPDYKSRNRIDVPGRKSFVEEPKLFQRQATTALRGALSEVVKLQKFVNIVILSDDRRIANSTIKALRELNFEDYYVSWVGISKSDIEDDFENNEGIDFCQEHFYHYECSVNSFFCTFYEYAENWERRVPVTIDYALPIGSGSYVSLDENTRNNLFPYFEVLYKNWDLVTHPDDACADSFQKGGRATWKDIASGEALSLDPEKETQLKDRIKLITGKAQEDMPQKNLFIVAHKAGIGGTTFVKRVAWKLHNDMAVLEIKHYDDKKTFPLLQDLYDNRIERNPILLIAEDTIPNLEALCDAFLVTMKNRRCALLIACRENHNLCDKYKNSNKIAFTQLRTEAIDTLKNKFKSISPLSSTELVEKTKNFETEVINDIRTPFIIGLYFLEKEFHIESYVSKVLNNTLLPLQKDMIALLALCDIYDSKELPSAFINKALGYNLRTRSSLIQSCPGAESLICRDQNINGIEVYYFKHKLLSEQYFKSYTEKQDGGLGRYELAKKLIELAAKCQNSSERECVSDTLLDILIRNKDIDINDMSQLLTDIAIPESQRALVDYLAVQFKPNADAILSEMDWDKPENLSDTARNILRLVSHAYAHLGKLYAKPPENYEKAAQYLTLAEHYMPYEDSFIYHMHGNVIYHQLRKQWKDALENRSFDIQLSSTGYAEMVNTSFELFAKTSEYGDVQYGITGQLNLLYEYLKFIYKANEIHTKEDLRKLTHQEMFYQTLFIDTLDTAKQYDNFDEKVMYNIQIKENQLRSEVLMGDYGKTIEHYQNEYDRLKNSSDTDRALAVLNGLVSARIQKAKEIFCAAESKGESFYEMINSPRTLFEQIETLLPTLYNKRGYSAYGKRTSLLHHWFQLSKLLDHPICEALIKARYWVDSEDQLKGKKNPEPYYYLQTLLYLEKMDGSEYDNELRSVRSTISDMNSMQQFDSKRGTTSKFRDILVVGKGMGKLLNVADCGTTPEIASRIATSKKIPIEFSGNVENIQYWGAEISIYAPSEFSRQKIISEIGRMSKNTLAEGQINHKVKFFSGFTTLGIRAIGDSVKDQDTGEHFNVVDIISNMKRERFLPITKTKCLESTESKLTQYANKKTLNASCENNNADIGKRKKFRPEYIKSNPNKLDELQYLNGTVDDGKGSISAQYFLELFGERTIDGYGGICKVLETLINKIQTIDVIVKTVQLQDGQKRYTFGLYDETIELSKLIQLPKEAISHSQNCPHELPKAADLFPDYNGKQVRFIPNDPTLSKTSGRFQIDGAEYEGTLINVKTKKDREKAQKFKERIPATIQGKPQSGKYVLRMK